MLEHGGNLRAAMAQFARPPSEWIDLSTGINPLMYPAPAVHVDAWQRLPEPSPALIAAACSYYGAPALLPVAGTQAAIQALPQLRAHSRVAVVSPTYAEHAHQWRRALHDVREVSHAELDVDVDAVIDACDVLVLCNPNNPTGARIAPECLLDWAERLAARGGWLVVDEAFGDMEPALSVAQCSDRAGLIVLRSVGKFFGLAGLRLGFVAAERSILKALEDEIGPWSVSGPAQQIGCAALADIGWQTAMRAQLTDAGLRLQQLLARHAIASRGTALFQWWPEPDAVAFRQHFAEAGIWVRLFTAGAGGIRLGLPPDEAAWQRLSDGLAGWISRQGKQ
ncbi:threonine-phosphate decarboxylase CobD [Actimicrobium sp. CCC2.4]|uniref:threonine-phosphate decarboxylase CobD n=1 Tax=Actimicrobium sp. CCC2.4 TaxID=3048606 RepID=UPI002AC959BE|nr:threonine-phosphate decarboxylase CobD [Actimicrobium sp. CCC2.4]MEB0136821.1 threonine-phosphate decarboxylase CobD [Actimicrobium sp. CCC2.4]WPX33902.1 threonine-phosphate decarboxylase CobD [Actimicrobium sp. CCC2.4]